jgi:hypothetical protein
MRIDGHRLGLLRLDTAFPRPRGDAGEPSSWPLPVIVAVVDGATPAKVVHGTDDGLLAPFTAAARALVAQGATAVTTSCGFLACWQRELQAAVPVPVFTSSLLAVPHLPDAGVVTVDAQALGPRHWHGVSASPRTPVAGLAPGCHLQRVLLGNEPRLDMRQARLDAVDAALRLVRAHPQVRHIVLECTNLPPYAAAIAQATGRPVHHLITWVTSALRRLRDPSSAPDAAPGAPS